MDYSDANRRLGTRISDRSFREILQKSYADYKGASISDERGASEVEASIDGDNDYMLRAQQRSDAPSPENGTSEGDRMFVTPIPGSTPIPKPKSFDTWFDRLDPANGYNEASSG